MQMRKGLAFGKEISTQSVSIFDASISHLRFQFMDFRKYSIMPPPALFCVSDLSFRMRSKPSMQNTVCLMGGECLRKFECRYATEKLLDRLVFWSGPCLLLFALLSDQCSVRRLRHD